jgi:putative glutamine amidotransferase
MDNATINQRFGALVVEAGGIPIATDVWADPFAIVDRVDAVVVNGGVDVDPALYGASPHPATDPPQPRRDAFELGLIRAAADRGIPTLGICRGMHLLNIAQRGTLTQHLPDHTALEHYVRDPYDRPVHEIEIEPGSRLAAAFGRRTAAVNTVHHQAIDRLGSGLLVTARTPDGTIEAIENAEHSVIGVQWHPEFLLGATADDQVALFRTFLRECVRFSGRPAHASSTHHRSPLEVAR